MNFSVVLIARNEEKTLPRLLKSLSEFQNRGGEIILVDTGSTDKTVEIAKSLGCKVTEVSDKFMLTINNADELNKKFIVDKEGLIVKDGDTIFDYSSARNYAATLASNDMIAMPDCDEEYTKLHLDRVELAINDGNEQLEYPFVFSHDAYGNEAIKFLHCKFYDRRKLKWTGLIHEVLAGSAKRILLDESVIKLEHWQNQSQNREHYLKGLALDCLLNPDNDRNSHYFARELLWSGRPKSAIQEFRHHISFDRWPAEKAQSLIYVGDAEGILNRPSLQVDWYCKAFYIDSGRNEALIKLARFYQHNQNYIATACYAAAALQVPYNGYYGNQMEYYTNVPNELLYWAKGWMGQIEEAKVYIAKALEYQPCNPVYLRDLRYYYLLPTVSFVVPTLGRPESLQRCLTSIDKLNYPQELIEKIVLDDEEQTVTQKVADGYARSTGEYIVYGSNDCEFTPDSLIIAVWESMQKKKGLIAFNTGKILPDEGNICEHFLIKKDLVPKIGGEIFSTKLKHVGCDNLLWAQCKKLGENYRSTHAVVNHYHFTHGAPMDEVYEKGWATFEEDRVIMKEELSKLTKIPKKIWMIWLSRSTEIPELVQTCIDSAKVLTSYEFNLITLDNCWKKSRYVNECIESNNWTKAADFLRMYYLYNFGGIYLDADTEVIKDFDSMLGDRLFCGEENDNKCFANGIIGAEPKHPLIGEYLRKIEANFRGDGDMVFEPGVRAFTDLIWMAKVEGKEKELGITVYPPEYFFPYNPYSGVVKVNPHTVTYHHYMSLWKKGK